MGKRLVLNPSFSFVVLPGPDGVPRPYSGATVDVTDAEYAALSSATLRAVTSVTTIADPSRPTSPGTASTKTLYASLARTPEALFVGPVARDANGAPISASVVWPDGTPGTYQGTPSTTYASAVDSYTITYGNPVQQTYVQQQITRTSSGSITNFPALTVVNGTYTPPPSGGGGSSSPEHTIFGASAYGGKTITLGTDGNPSIALAQSFYRTGSSPAYRFKGGRIYIPASLTALSGASVTFSFYRTGYSTPLDLTATPIETKTVTVTVGGWTEARMTTPQSVAAAERCWVVYTFGNTNYLAAGDGNAPAIQATDGATIYIASASEGGVSRSGYRLGSGSFSGNANLYAIDAIFDEG